MFDRMLGGANVAVVGVSLPSSDEFYLFRHKVALQNFHLVHALFAREFFSIFNCINSFTAIRVWAGTKYSHPVGFVR
jgi:hypothetical protein